MSTVNKARTIATNHRSNRSERTYLLVVALPPLVLLSVFAYGAIREGYAAAANTAQLVQIQNDGNPIDNHSMTQWFDRRTSKENSTQWRDVFVATRGLGNRFGILATDWVVDFERLVAPDQPWDAEPIASRYAEEAQPILDSIEKLVSNREPVWEPLLIEGQMTLLAELQESRGIVKVLANEFRVAVHQGDQPRAFRALELIRGVSEAFDWNIGLISDFVVFGHRNTYRSLVRGSLQFSFWTEPQLLAKLQQQLSKADALDARWQDSLASEQAMSLVELSDDTRGGSAISLVSDINLFPFGVPATTKARFLEIMRQLESVKNPGTTGHAAIVDGAIQNNLRSTSNSAFTITGIPFATGEIAIGMLYPAVDAAAATYVRNERERRWTLTAVAIKEFQMQQQRWPDSLDELTSVGLSASDWMVTDSAAFGYQINDDGDEAILWTTPSDGTPLGAALLPQPPSIHETDPVRLEQIEVRISK